MTVTEQRSADPGADAVADLEDAAEAYRRARDAVEAQGREDLEELADALQQARALLREYQDKATDTGAREFVEFAQFKGQFTTHVEELDDDLPARSAFEDALEAVDRSRLDEGDFERARSALEPAAALVERLDDLDDAGDRLLDARRRAERRRGELREAVAERERLLELGEADLDAPIELLREPIDRWNEAAGDAVRRLRTEAPARELVDVLDRAALYPLVDLPAPTDRLADYLRETPVGEEPPSRLLEYADFSASKLEHYVDDPDRFRRTVGTERGVLEGVTPASLAVSWPPPPAERVAWRVRALRHVLGGRVAEDGVAALRELAAAARDRERYERLRTAAIAHDELDEADRRRLEAGEVATELERYRDAVERVETTLEAVPEP